VLSLSARGLTTGEVSAHFAEVYGASVSREAVSKITDQVLEEMSAWMNRPLDEANMAARFTRRCPRNPRGESWSGSASSDHAERPRIHHRSRPSFSGEQALSSLPAFLTE
jgi:Transposase, Mutator family